MSENLEETTRIYTGPMMIAQGLRARLNELGIEPIIKDDHQSGITSGFAIGVPGQVRVFIRKDELPAAQSTIDSYLQDIGE
ncbi:MAG TPA: DUF2007 domain-containing protein [Flavobacteriaceae bacterium]|jgi:hypothetical protein|nr:hypothetical protein [Flavobacteriaceae bacterium]HBR54023.1 hypothetical protein [Flavobacteriaceae bacterium]HIB48090.1 DUF2007 domain-containing protein [Flavobacteriaceae bacterium]HIN98542.1 DUF2007 domain-containing protein [Flavobacteriaceae bacterium]|tara:strand:+ start:117885 stop:118127 length:243 start_codon:yes stop_codon:yes gene_type:complete